MDTNAITILLIGSGTRSRTSGKILRLEFRASCWCALANSELYFRSLPFVVENGMSTNGIRLNLLRGIGVAGVVIGMAAQRPCGMPP